MAWGSGLSDEETLAWQLAERWQIPVYNGARTRMGNIVNHPKLGEIETFIHVITEVNAIARHVGVATTRKPARFRPLRTTGESMFDTMVGNVGWWSPWANLQRSAGRFGNDLFILWDHMVRGIEPPTHHFLGPANCEVDMDLLLNKVRRNRDFFAARGARYAFIVVPSKRTVIGSRVGAPVRACNVEYLQKLIRSLRKEYVPTVDLIPALQAVPEPYMAYDTHCNGSGVQAAALAIADRMRKEGVVRSR